MNDNDLSDDHLARIGLVCTDARRAKRVKVTIEEGELCAMVEELQRRRLEERLRLSLIVPSPFARGETL